MHNLELSASNMLLKYLQIFKINCSLEVKLNQVRASREVRFPRILECSWVKEKSFLIADSLVISKWQTSLEWFPLIITFAFIWLAKQLTKSYFIQAPILCFFLKFFVVCERKKDWNYYQPLYVIHWPHVCLKLPSLAGMQAIYILFHKLAQKKTLNQVGFCWACCIIIWTRL